MLMDLTLASQTLKKELEVSLDVSRTGVKFLHPVNLIVTFLYSYILYNSADTDMALTINNIIIRLKLKKNYTRIDLIKRK
jgi:hypothetical protein